MLIKFTKMQSLGHDIMLVNCVTQKVFFSPELIRRLAHRHFGVGFEFLLVVEPPYNPDQDFHYQIYNHDGETVEEYIHWAACCCMRFVFEHRLTSKRRVVVSTPHGSVRLSFNNDDTVTAIVGDEQKGMTSSCERIYEGSLVL